MSFSDQEITRLRDAYRSIARAAVAGPDCPEPETLWRAANGELPPADTRTLVDHTATCPSCAEDWRLAQELTPETEPAVTTFRPRRPLTASSWWLVAAAAVLLFLVTLPVWRSSAPLGQPEAVRAPGESMTIQSLISDAGLLPRDQCVLRWTSGSRQVAAYNLLVSTESFDVLIRRQGFDESTFRVPSEVLRQVPAGGKILWQVEAIGSAGDRVTSPTFVNRLE